MKKIVPILLACALLLTFVSCVKYHAEVTDASVFYYKDHDGNYVFGQKQPVLTDAFRADTMVRGGWDAEGVDTDTLPEERTILIDEQAEFDAAFENCPFDVDLENEMIVVYTFSFIYSRPTLIKKVSFSDGTLSLKLESKRAKWGVKDASMPYQRYVIIKLDKLDVTEVKVDYTVR